MFQLYRGDPAAALEYGRRAFEIGHYWAYEFSSLDSDLIYEIKAGRYPEARAVVETIAPELLNEDSPEISEQNYKVAIDLALILSKLGEGEKADWLLERSLQYIQRIPRLGNSGYGVADVQIHALRGDKQKALSALQQAIDEGWRVNWWYYLQYEPTLESLHDDPEYQAMIEEIEADMSAQLERVREMERNGELAPIPDLAAA
jgi:tetratricopeptide (TPR) repeat protein